jgi:hypothetical protein
MKHHLVPNRALATRLPTLIALAATTMAACVGAATALEYRVLLRVVQGGASWPHLAWILAGTACGFVALVREILAWRRGEPRIRPFAPLRTLCIVVVVSWIGFLTAVELVERIWFELGLGTGAALWLAWIAVEGPSPRPPGRWRKAGEVVLFSNAAALILLEVVLRLWANAHPSLLFARLGDPPRVAVERTRLQPGELHLGFPCNRGGHYDEEFYRRASGERLVITIGDSFSLSVVPHAYHFTTVCEQKLGIPVDNMGIAGVGPPEYLGMLKTEAVPLDPSLVVIDLFVGNDFVFPSNTTGGLREVVQGWFERGNVLLWVVPIRLARLAEERQRRAAEGGRVAVIQGTDARSMGSVEATYPWVLDPMLEKRTHTEEGYLEIEARRAKEACRLRPSGMTKLHEILLEMRRTIGADRLCVMIIPDEYQIEDELWEKVVAEVGDPALDRYRVQSLILPWLAEQGIPCLDLTPRMLAEPPLEDGNRHLYHLRDTHWNARGNRIAGEALAEFLAPRLTPADTAGRR